jgi:hypothetical protein
MNGKSIGDYKIDKAFGSLTVILDWVFIVSVGIYGFFEGYTSGGNLAIKLFAGLAVGIIFIGVYSFLSNIFWKIVMSVYALIRFPIQFILDKVGA